MSQSSLPDKTYYIDGEIISVESQCTCRCVVLPDPRQGDLCSSVPARSQCTCRCVVLPDPRQGDLCSSVPARSQCTCRCVVLPDSRCSMDARDFFLSQCTCRCVVLPDSFSMYSGALVPGCLNAPAGAWCSLTPALGSGGMTPLRGPGAPPAPGAPLRTGQHRAQSST